MRNLQEIKMHSKIKMYSPLAGVELTHHYAVDNGVVDCYALSHIDECGFVTDYSMLLDDDDSRSRANMQIVWYFRKVANLR